MALRNTDLFTNFHYTVNSVKDPYLTWPYWIVAFFGALGVCEYVAHRRGRCTLISTIIEGYGNPLVAFFAVSFILAITNELQNLSVYVWRYANYPLSSIEVLHIPIFIILAWPLHIIFFVEAWNAFGPASSTVVFDQKLSTGE